eukprot:GHUV01027483.1.p1 GENE.GHUV01027483.1~~GHUV01027483.1.p1  ORF type:complete len:114 (+),score=6.65 GHUV01027483.1:562-903(+)
MCLFIAEYPEWAIPCLQQFPIPGHPRGLTLFDVSLHNEIYPGSKLTHFKQIHERSGIDYEDMVRRWRYNFGHFYNNSSTVKCYIGRIRVQIVQCLVQRTVWTSCITALCYCHR